MNNQPSFAEWQMSRGIMPWEIVHALRHFQIAAKSMTVALSVFKDAVSDAAASISILATNYKEEPNG